MPDPVVPAAEEQTPVADPQGQPKKETTPEPEKGGTTKEPPKEEKTEVIDLADVKKVDGKFVYTDPDNPEGTVYKGDSISDLMHQMAKGIKEKDSFIAQQKAKQVNIPSVAEIEDDIEADAEPQFADERALLLEAANKRGLDPAVFSYTDAKWKELEAQEGVRTVMKLENLKTAVEQEAAREAQAINLKAMNQISVKEQHTTIRQMCAEEGVEVDSIDWTKAFKEELENSKNYKNGLLRSGVLVQRAHKEITKVVRESLKSTTKKEVEKDIVEGKEGKKKAASDGSSVTASPKLNRAAPKSIEEARERAMESFRT